MTTDTSKKLLPNKAENISEWYNRLVLISDLAEYGPARGTMIIKPYGYEIWELAKQALDSEIKAKGVQNAYFPLFIPENLLQKEKAHVAGFSPELAVVTIGGGEELEEKLAVRPTSETIMYNTYAKWIESWRDLPLMINQWNNVVRWEKRTYLFLRTTEFLWQEGHTCHATHEEALDMMHWGINTYAKIYRDYYAMAGYIGKKSQTEKFAGAVDTLTYESLMPGGKALQSCTSHDLGQNFAKVFNISFQDKDGQNKHVWQTSWGFSTRSIGGLILAHGDNNGLRLPPKLAPIQVVIIPVKAETSILAKCDELKTQLVAGGVRATVDIREDETLGYKINKWELKGVPVRIEIGQREITSNTIVLARRDLSEKTSIPSNEVTSTIKSLLASIQTAMLIQSEADLQKGTFEVDGYSGFKDIMAGGRGFIKAFWCKNPECEAKIKEETKATTRCLPLDTPAEHGKCVYCGAPATHRWVFALAY